MFARLFPKQADNDYRGYRFAILLLVGAVLMRLVMGYAGLFNTLFLVRDADSIPIGTWPDGAAATMLFVTKVLSLDHLMLSFVAVAVLIRWRSLIPFAFLLLLTEQASRFALRLANPIPRVGASAVPVDPNLIIIAALLIGLALSLSSPRRM